MSQHDAHNMECGRIPKVFRVWLLWVLGPYNVLVYSMDSRLLGPAEKGFVMLFWLPTDCLHTGLGSGYKLFNAFVCKLDVHLPFGNDNKTSALLCRLSKHER